MSRPLFHVLPLVALALVTLPEEQLLKALRPDPKPRPMPRAVNRHQRRAQGCGKKQGRR